MARTLLEEGWGSVRLRPALRGRLSLRLEEMKREVVTKFISFFIYSVDKSVMSLRTLHFSVLRFNSTFKMTF